MSRAGPRVLSLGAVARSSMVMLAAESRILAFNVALFADTSGTPVPAGSAPRGLGTGNAFISLTALRGGLRGDTA